MDEARPSCEKSPSRGTGKCSKARTWLCLMRLLNGSPSSEIAHHTRGCSTIILPTKDGKSADDLEACPIFRLNSVSTNGKVMPCGLEHPCTCLSCLTTENIYVMFQQNTKTVNRMTVRGIPQAISSFVKLSKMISLRQVFGFEISSRREQPLQCPYATPEECYALAIQHGFYDQPKGYDSGACGRVGHCSFTYQEHLNQQNTPFSMGWPATLVAFAACKPLMKAATSHHHGQGPATGQVASKRTGSWIPIDHGHRIIPIRD